MLPVAAHQHLTTSQGGCTQAAGVGACAAQPGRRQRGCQGSQPMTCEPTSYNAVSPDYSACQLGAGRQHGHDCLLYQNM
jgi:hypothetical protein